LRAQLPGFTAVGVALDAIEVAAQLAPVAFVGRAGLRRRRWRWRCGCRGWGRRRRLRGRRWLRGGHGAGRHRCRRGLLCRGAGRGRCRAWRGRRRRGRRRRRPGWRGLWRRWHHRGRRWRWGRRRFRRHLLQAHQHLLRLGWRVYRGRHQAHRHPRGGNQGHSGSHRRRIAAAVQPVDHHPTRLVAKVMDSMPCLRKASMTSTTACQRTAWSALTTKRLRGSF
jgi:hypothetical protein